MIYWYTRNQVQKSSFLRTAQHFSSPVCADLGGSRFAVSKGPQTALLLIFRLAHCLHQMPKPVRLEYD